MCLVDREHFLWQSAVPGLFECAMGELGGHYWERGRVSGHYALALRTVPGTGLTHAPTRVSAV